MAPSVIYPFIFNTNVYLTPVERWLIEQKPLFNGLNVKDVYIRKLDPYACPDVFLLLNVHQDKYVNLLKWNNVFQKLSSLGVSYASIGDKNDYEKNDKHLWNWRLFYSLDYSGNVVEEYLTQTDTKQRFRYLGAHKVYIRPDKVTCIPDVYIQTTVDANKSEWNAILMDLKLKYSVLVALYSSNKLNHIPHFGWKLLYTFNTTYISGDIVEWVKENSKYLESIGLKKVYIRMAGHRERIITITGVYFVVEDFAQEDQWKEILNQIQTECETNLEVFVDDHFPFMTDGKFHKGWKRIIHRPGSSLISSSY